MNPHPATPLPAGLAAMWTIDRIPNTLSNGALIRRFLLDLVHAPEPRLMGVFTAWQKIATTIEAHAAQQLPAANPGSPGSPRNSPAPSAGDAPVDQNSQSQGALPQGASRPQAGNHDAAGAHHDFPF